MFKESATLDFHYNKIDEAALAFFRSIVGDEFGDFIMCKFDDGEKCWI